MMDERQKRNRNRMAVLAQVSLWTLLVLSLANFSRVALEGMWTWSLVPSPTSSLDLSFGLRFDWLSSLVFLMVTVLGTAIGHYARRFLHGEERQGYFYKYLVLAVGSVSLFVLSSQMVMFFLAWLAVSFCLHRLLLMHNHRPAAVLAARKRVLVGFIGNTAFLAAVVFTFFTFGTFQFDDIFRLAQNPSFHGSSLTGLALLIAVVALVQSAQVPFHFWLPETMETPAPVSALMHAGIINAGGYLLIRMSPILKQAEVALAFVAFAGALSAVLAALVMVTQNDIKKKLAYSTISQMGMMIFACGLGAYSVALFHIVAHSFYKASAFLSTGFLVEESKKVGFKLAPSSRGHLIFMGVLGFAIVGAGAIYNEGSYLAYFTYSAVLLLGLFQNAGGIKPDNLAQGRIYAKITAMLGFSMLFYILIESGLNQKLQGLAPEAWGAQGLFSTFALVNFMTFALFLGGAWLSASLMRPDRPYLQRLYMYLWNGAYLSQLTTRWMLWRARRNEQRRLSHV